ncbi:hypothetical protein EV363DRAFT_1251147 [Boletus edulis]|uniref:Uncharacterized protein n=1 Tax=Boletus edulis BED1 TaxID=1328754 RepID=A0AAD4C1S3_BOLED|nr:hypothetical protein EV363DRAFT_1251147 [Boletus edulis]KAF8445675.1 hypothetical protein L210DRAFT_3442078 [Boletus edulis BED1]
MPSARTIDAILSDLRLPTRTFPLSFTEAFTTDARGVRVGLSTSRSQRLPDVTAVILNWSRLENVIRIVSLLCGPWLDDTIAEVYVWNNSPKNLSKEIFSSAHCDTRKLKIENSPENLYFYARFLACTKASSPYCFIQDDDYIILPELIKTLRIRVEESSQGGIYLLPPHEHLSSRLRTTVTSDGIHTGFAWLGHGAMINRQRALSFVSLLHDDSLGMTKEQVRMADNYFTVLSNEIPEIWFDQGIELGGGQPFTVGHEGNERNQLHIGNACRYLDEIVARPSAVTALSDTQTGSLGFVKRDGHVSNPEHLHVNRAAALGTPYLLESNIKLLPDDNIPNCLAAIDLLGNEERRAGQIGQDAILHYQQHALSYAVDGNASTAFRSPYDAKQGDYILIDTLSVFEFNNAVVELVFLVATNNEDILRRSKYECSSDGKCWLLSPYYSVSRPTTVVAESTHDLLEYSVRMAGNHARFFKVTAGEDVSLPWVIYEVWVRSVLQIV